MTSEEYIQQVDRLMSMQDNHMNKILTLIAILIAVAALYQWTLNFNTKKALRKEVDKKVENLKEETLVKSIKNLNGSITSFPDGTLMCTNILTLDKQLEDRYSWTFPALFYDEDIVIIAKVKGYSDIEVKIDRTEKVRVFFKIEGETTRIKKDDYLDVHFLAIGRWKDEN